MGIFSGAITFKRKYFDRKLNFGLMCLCCYFILEILTCLLFIILVFFKVVASNISMVNYFFVLLGFEPRISGIGSNRCANCATTADHILENITKCCNINHSVTLPASIPSQSVSTIQLQSTFECVGVRVGRDRSRNALIAFINISAGFNDLSRMKNNANINNNKINSNNNNNKSLIKMKAKGQKTVKAT